MPADKAGRVVFIGNIPYGLTEEQIIHTFSTVGQVLNFRLVYDRDTGRPKGFGFAEFSDADAAASAVRNLNDYEIMGRKLRVDFSHEGGEEDAAPAGYVPQPPPPMNGAGQLPHHPPPSQASGLPPLPPGVDLAPNLTCPDAISSTLSTLPPPQLLDILSQMKGLVMSDPAKATELLKQAPQLSYAIFQALLLMGLVNTSVLASVVEQASQPAPPPQPTPQPQPPPPQSYLPQSQPLYGQYPSLPGPTHIATPPVQSLPYAPPPVQQAPPAVPIAIQEELLKQVLAMTPQQIDALPPAERSFTADVVGRATAKTALNPAVTIPLLLFLRYTYRGQYYARGKDTAIRRLKLLIYIGLARWVNGIVNRGVLDNWQSDMYDWKREIVIVTGGSDGIGKRTVMLLAEKGIKVVVLDVQPLTFEDATSNVLYYKCDITSPKAVAAAAAEIRSIVGHPTVLINNAGAARGKTILDSTEGDVRLTFDVNTLSHYWLAKEFLPHMVSQNHGMVVTVASLAAYVTAPQMVDYAASKAAALTFHEGLAAELKTRYNAPKVRTVVITQGFTKTPLFMGYENDSKFLMPTLEADTVAEAIVKKVLAGTSGQVILPGAANFMAVVIRSWPFWLQARVRNDLEKIMRTWHGRQVVDPEERYEQVSKSDGENGDSGVSDQ